MMMMHGEIVSETPSSITASEVKQNKKSSLDDYQLLKVIGKGCMGKVLLAREKSSGKVFAIKSISKKWVISHGLQEVEHIMAEQQILASLSRIRHPFLIRLHCSFQNKDNLFLVMEYTSGGDLATQLELFGRFDLERARFYCAEIVCGIVELHRLGIAYRDCKPENVLIGSDGHIKLTDFGLSKQFKISARLSHDHSTCMGSRDCKCLTTNTFCGTSEYLSPEILLERPYSFEVDWWSVGTFLYEMLVGITPFWAENHHEMYSRVLEDRLEFPADFPSDDARDLITRLLERDPTRRLGYRGNAEIMNHHFFANIDWDAVKSKSVAAPYIPQVRSEMDVRWFDRSFTQMPVKISPPSNALLSPGLHEGILSGATNQTSSASDAFQGYTYLSQSAQRLMHNFGQNYALFEARYAKKRRIRESALSPPPDICTRHSSLLQVEEEEEEEGLDFNIDL